MPHLVAPSLLSADFANLQAAVELVDRSSAPWLHLDVMDGVFVPNISFGLPVIKAIRKHTRKTFEFAERVKAKLVVLHLGSLELPDYNTKLEKLLEAGERHTPKYRRLCQHVAARREARKGPYVANLYAALKTLLPEAEAKGLLLGAECREAIEEIPLDTDFRALLEDFPSPNLVYWHDTGHAQIKDNLGFIHHASQLESLQDRLYGFHLHDVQYPGKDHCPIGKGMIDWAALKPVAKPHHLKVLELNPGMSVENVQGSYDYIRAVWGPE